MTSLRQRLARLEAHDDPDTDYFISDEPEGEAPAVGSYAIGPEMSGDEWARSYCDQAEEAS
ncbi:hypothetical protein [Devosia marina]|uniref:Uncharacterized protein n=1 Tax=Devosia marina TaxID=2683198 RepID=A0A7X3FSV3_9HYPH|nr:hypothetical protein [Devosia marina]MVS99255.1 hypothetical protein [Devosia marina]